MRKLSVSVTVIVLLALLSGARPAASARMIFSTGASDKANGWWLLHEYHDRILNNKCIGAFSFEEPVYSAIILKITPDSVFTAGSLLPRKIYARSDHGDTIVRLGHFQKMPLVYRSKKSELIVTFTGNDSSLQTFHYRRMNSIELFSLTRGLFETIGQNENGIPVNTGWTLKTNYNQYFRRQFFSGTYTGVGHSAVMMIQDNGSLSGYEKWNHCEIDDFFGTTHWFGKQDRVRFEDSTATGKFQDFNWQYRGDTLVLRKYAGAYPEVAKLTAKEILFVRSPVR